MRIFIENCYQDAEVARPLRRATLEAFTKDRQGNVTDLQLLGQVVKCYAQMGFKKPVPVKGNPVFVWQGTKNLDFYQKEFERHLIERASEEYKQLAQQWIADSSAPGYLQLVDRAYSHESNTCDELLQSETRNSYLKAIVTELITNMRQAVVDKETGCRYMITNKRTEELQLLFKCYKWEAQNLGVIIACMQEHIHKIGRGYNEDETIKKDPIKFT